MSNKGGGGGGGGGEDSFTAADKLINKKYGAGPEGADFQFYFKHRDFKDKFIKENWLNSVCPCICGSDKAQELACGLGLREKIRLDRLHFDWARRCPRRPQGSAFWPPPPPCLPECRDYPECPMYPVNWELGRWLNMGTRKDGTGGATFLHLRKHFLPECKYTLPPTVNTEYGWRLGDACSKWGPDFYRTHMQRRTFWRRRYTLPQLQAEEQPPFPFRNNRPPLHPQLI